jgi:hypothetical protein
MLRKLAGFDVVSFDGSKVLFNAYSQTIGAGGTMPIGRDGYGYALGMTNTGFGEANWSTTFDEQATWGFHLDWRQQSNTSVTPAGIIWYRIYNSARPGQIMVSLRTRSDGKMDVLDYTYSVITTTTVGLPPNEWHTIEFQCSFADLGFELRFDGAPVATGLIAPITGYPDTMNLRMQYLGSDVFEIDNYVIWDGQPNDGYSDFIGRVRIDSLRTQSDDNDGWLPKTGTRRWYQVREDDTEIFGHTQGPDGDATYIEPPGSGSGDADQLMGVEPSPCYGKVMAVSVYGTCRPAVGDQIISFLFQGASSVHALDVGHLVTPVGNPFGDPWPDYLSYQSIAPVDPDTGATWIDAAITNGSWGVRALATANVYATQVWIEKLTSLTPQPYTCGGGNYVY